MKFNTPPCPRILFCSLSSKYALYREVLSIARLFSKDVTLVGADCDVHCEAANLVEEFIEFPRLENLSCSKLLQICKLNKITHVLPTRDTELEFWAMHSTMLQQHKITPWVSDLSFTQKCNDKWVFAKEWRNAAVPSIPTLKRPDLHVSEKWVAKDRFGSGSRKLLLNLSYKEAMNLSSDSVGDLVYQPFIEGREFTVEAWISRKNKVHGPILRWRHKVVNGESHETSVFRNKKYEELLSSVFLQSPGAYGHCLAQVLVDPKGRLHLIEINPRLGGASPLALRAGLQSIAWHLMEDFGHAEKIPNMPSFVEGMSLSKKGLDVTITN